VLHLEGLYLDVLAAQSPYALDVLFLEVPLKCYLCPEHVDLRRNQNARVAHYA
jgi:hypothetical protein